MTEPDSNGKAGKPVRGRSLAALLFVLAIVGLTWGATQYAAARMSYHPALGRPWFGHVYAPWSWLWWQARWYDNAPATFNTLYFVFLAGLALAFLGLVLFHGFAYRSARRHEGMHGTAHWATPEEVEATGLLKHLETGA